MSKWGTRVGAPLGKAWRSIPFCAALRKMAEIATPKKVKAVLKQDGRRLRAKFSDEQVRAIRASRKSYKELAVEYQTTPHFIYQISVGEIYRYVI
jgi:hypothetical protein